MSIRSLIIGMLVSISILSCNSGSQENKSEKPEANVAKEESTGYFAKEESAGFVAKVDSSMTLTQVAKANNIGEPYLRTALGLRKGIGSKYTISEMAKRFTFTIDDVKKIIEDRKNKQASKKKPQTSGEGSR